MRKSNVFLMAGALLLAASLSVAAFYTVEAYQAGKNAGQAYEALAAAEEDNGYRHPNSPGEIEIPGYLLIPGMEMPTIEIDGVSYVGTIEIPSIERSLPVVASCDPISNLDLGPCLYYGSIYEDNAVICGHSYISHFGPLSSVSAGDTVFFRDVEGNLFRYIVSEEEILDQYDVNGMIQESDSWDLTLFTCTPWHTSRLTLRLTRQ